MRFGLLMIGVAGICLVAVGLTAEIGLKSLDDEGINLWAATLVYPPNVPPASNGDPYYEIQLFHPKTGQSWTIADGYGTEEYWVYSRWSPDGKWLLFDVGSVRNINQRVYRAHWTGGKFEELSNGDLTFLKFYYWSPDREWVAWQVPTEDLIRSWIFVRRPNGSRIHALGDTTAIAFNDFNPLMRWSADGEWIFIMGHEVNPSKIEYIPKTWRIRVDTGAIEEVLVLNQGDELYTFIVLGDQLVYVLQTIDGIEAYVTRIGSHEGRKVAEFDGMTDARMWQPSPDVVLMKVDNNWRADAGRYYIDTVRIDLETGAVRRLLELDDGTVVDSGYGPDFSDDGQYFAISGVEDGRQSYRFVMEVDGENAVWFPNVNCNVGYRYSDLKGVWKADMYIFIDEVDETHCRLMRYRIGDDEPRVVQDFPEGAGGIEFLDTQSRQWLRYLLDETVYITNFEGTVVFPTARAVRFDYTDFVELPLEAVDSRRMIVVGIGCIGVMVIGSWKMS